MVYEENVPNVTDTVKVCHKSFPLTDLHIAYTCNKVKLLNCPKKLNFIISLHYHSIFLCTFIYIYPHRCRVCVLFSKANKNLDMSINASNNFNLNITWSVGSTGNGLNHFAVLLNNIQGSGY